MLVNLFTQAGWVRIPLGICGVLALAIILYKLFALWRIQVAEDDAFAKLVPALKNGDDRLLADKTIAEAPSTQILHAVAALRGASEDAAMTAAEIALSQQRLRLRSFLGTLATIGSTAPFIGLFGTVIGVMQAFQSIGKNGLDQNTIAGGIAEALSATALGLLVAIPSVMMYNFMLGRVQSLLLRIHGHMALLTPLLHGIHPAPNAANGGANGMAGYAPRRPDYDASPNGSGAVTSATNVSVTQQEA